MIKLMLKTTSDFNEIQQLENINLQLLVKQITHELKIYPVLQEQFQKDNSVELSNLQVQQHEVLLMQDYTITFVL